MTRQYGVMPRLAQPAGSDDAREPVALLGNLVKVGIIRVLRETPDVTISALCDALSLGATTIQPYLAELEVSGLVIADPPSGVGRRGVWVRYRANEEMVTDLYLRLGFALREF